MSASSYALAPTKRPRKPEIIIKTNKSYEFQYRFDGISIKKDKIWDKLDLRESGRKNSQIIFANWFFTFLVFQAPLYHFKGDWWWLQIEGNQICGCNNDWRFSSYFLTIFFRNPIAIQFYWDLQIQKLKLRLICDLIWSKILLISTSRNSLKV